MTCFALLVAVTVPSVSLVLWPGRGNVLLARGILSVVAILVGLVFAGAFAAGGHSPEGAGCGMAIMAGGFTVWGLVFYWARGLEPAAVSLQRGRVHVAPKGMEVVYLPGPPFRARLRYGMQSAEKERFLYVEFACPLPENARRFVVASEEWRGKLNVDPRLTSLDVGEWPYLVRTNDAAFTSQFLDAPTRALIRRIDLMHSGSFLLDVRPGQMAIRSGARIAEQERMNEFVAACYQLGSMLKPSSEGVEVVEVVMAREKQAVCRVCGVAVDEPSVRCAVCHSPHHADCWEYNGGCSVYACGSRQASA